MLSPARAALVAIFILGAAPSAAPRTDQDQLCGTCHPKEAERQGETSMARAMFLPGSEMGPVENKKLTFDKDGYSYAIERVGKEIIYTIRQGNEAIAFQVKWVIGAQSHTYLIERHGIFYESLVSYYPLIHGLDFTIGDEAIQPKSLMEAMGRALTVQEVRRCLGCHSTGATVENDLINHLVPGVRCQHCHMGALDHMQSIVAGKLTTLPPKLQLLTSDAMSNFCGQCHRTWEQVAGDHISGESNVRFQPYRLANSKCFDGGDRRISCVACHDPHVEVVRQQTSYDRKCLACHRIRKTKRGVATLKTDLPGSAATAKACPRATTNCVGCHMPLIALPSGHLRFRDHMIRIVREQDGYPE